MRRAVPHFSVVFLTTSGSIVCVCVFHVKGPSAMAPGLVHIFAVGSGVEKSSRASGLTARSGVLSGRSWNGCRPSLERTTRSLLVCKYVLCDRTNFVIWCCRLASPACARRDKRERQRESRNTRRHRNLFASLLFLLEQQPFPTAIELFATGDGSRRLQRGDGTR